MRKSSGIDDATVANIFSRHIKQFGTEINKYGSIYIYIYPPRNSTVTGLFDDTLGMLFHNPGS